MSRAIWILGWMCFKFLSLSDQAFADMIYLGFENNPEEIKVIQEEADRRGEKLLLPIRAGGSTNGEKELLTALQDVKKRKGGPITLIISAHSANINDNMVGNGSGKHDADQRIWGTYGGINRSVIPSLIRQAGCEKDVQSLLLLGCYTGSQDNIRIWHNGLPSVKVMGGWPSRAPSGARPGNLNFIRKFLKNEHSWASVCNLSEASNQYSSVLGSSGAAVCMNGNYLYGKTHKKLGDPDPDCELRKLEQRFGPMHVAYDKYRLAQVAGFEDVPEDVGKSVLRSYYNQMNDKAHCIFPQEWPHRENILRLIFEKTYLENFQKYFKYRLDWMNQIYGRHGLKNPLPRPLTSVPNRQALLLAIEKIGTTVKQSHSLLGESDSNYLLEMKKTLEVYLRDLKCGPISWVEPTGDDYKMDRPECRDDVFKTR